MKRRAFYSDGIYRGRCHACDRPLSLIIRDRIFCLRETKTGRPHNCPCGDFPTAGEIRWFKERRARGIRTAVLAAPVNVARPAYGIPAPTRPV